MTSKFSNLIIRLCKQIVQDTITRPTISQLIKSGTSVGANYTEANNASSPNDFRNKIYICKKEICETKYWLKIIKSNNFTQNPVIENVQRKAEELTLIFGRILSSLKNNSKLKHS